jgi:hypothetical protein
MGLEACYSGRQKMLSCGSGSLKRRKHSAIGKANVQFGRGNLIYRKWKRHSGIRKENAEGIRGTGSTVRQTPVM